MADWRQPGFCPESAGSSIGGGVARALAIGSCGRAGPAACTRFPHNQRLIPANRTDILRSPPEKRQACHRTLRRLARLAVIWLTAVDPVATPRDAMRGKSVSP